MGIEDSMFLNYLSVPAPETLWKRQEALCFPHPGNQYDRSHIWEMKVIIGLKQIMSTFCNSKKGFHDADKSTIVAPHSSLEKFKWQVFQVNVFLYLSVFPMYLSSLTCPSDSES